MTSGTTLSEATTSSQSTRRYWKIMARYIGSYFLLNFLEAGGSSLHQIIRCVGLRFYKMLFWWTGFNDAKS
jgi:hypothetical protein